MPFESAKPLMNMDEHSEESAIFVPCVLGRDFFAPPEHESQSGYYHFRFGLSPKPSAAWMNLFPEVWADRVQYTSHRVGVDADAVWIICRMEEVVRHFPFLEKAVELTNELMEERHGSGTPPKAGETPPMATVEEKLNQVQEQLRRL